jgi:hypothetical protein
MAKPLLLLLHGSGVYSPEWASVYVEHLEHLAQGYPAIAQRGALGDQAVLKPLNYDSVFEGLLGRWDEQGDRLDQLAEESQARLPRVAAVLRETTLPPDERSFLWTHVLDPLSYRSIGLVRDEVRALVLAQVVTAVNEHLEAHPGGEVSVLGHSLGTIILHDVLHLLGSGQAAEGGGVMESDRFRFKCVFQVANVSRLGPSRIVDLNPYESVVRPVSAGPAEEGGPPPYVSFFFNIHNRWDPLTWWQPFKPRGWGPGYVDVALTHMHQINTHGLLHYLKHPDVHVPLFRGLLGGWSVPTVEWHGQLARFPNLDLGPCSDRAIEFVSRLDQLREAADGRNLDDVAMGLLELYRLVKEARTACEPLFNEIDGWL